MSRSPCGEHVEVLAVAELATGARIVFSLVTTANHRPCLRIESVSTDGGSRSFGVPASATLELARAALAVNAAAFKRGGGS